MSNDDTFREMNSESFSMQSIPTEGVDHKPVEKLIYSK